MPVFLPPFHHFFLSKEQQKIPKVLRLRRKKTQLATLAADIPWRVLAVLRIIRINIVLIYITYSVLLNPGRDGLLKASLKLKSQADGLKAGYSGA